MRPRNNLPIARGGASGLQYQRAHGMGSFAQMMPSLGQVPAQAGPPIPDYKPDPWADWSEIPAFYTVSIVLGGEPDKTASNATPLRPEPFVLKRITFATTGDVVFPIVLSSIMGRTVEVTWQDEFTRFFGEQPCLISAAFGDSEGFLDLPAPVLFQGRQSLSVNLRRLLWPFPPDEIPPVDTRWDFQFQGVALLPPGVGSSGSVR